MFAIDEIRCVFLSQSPVELLHTFKCISHALRDYLDDPLVLEPLCKNNRIPVQSSIVSFFDVYNRKHLLVRSHDLRYTNIYAHTLPLNKLLARAAKYEHYDLLDSVLDREMLWCSVPHMKIICSRVSDKEMFGKYTEKMKRMRGLCYVKVRHAYKCGCARRGVGLSVGGEFGRERAYLTAALGNGHWDLVPTSVQGATLTVCVLTERRFDLLESDGDYVRVKGVPKDYPIPMGPILKTEAFGYVRPSKVKHVHALERLGVVINPSHDYMKEIGSDISNKELFDYLNRGDQYDDIMCQPGVDFKRAHGWSNNIFDNLMWLRENHPEVIYKEMIIESMGCIVYAKWYNPYELRRMIEIYPHLLETFGEDIHAAVRGDELMKNWLSSIVQCVK